MMSHEFSNTHKCIYKYVYIVNAQTHACFCIHTQIKPEHKRAHTHTSRAHRQLRKNQQNMHTYIHTQAPLGNVLRSLLVQVMCRGSSSTTTCEPWRLARLLFCAGHIAIKMLACAEGIGAEQARTMEANTNQGKPLDPCILVFLIMISLCLVYVQ